VKRRILVALALVGLLSLVLISRAGAASPTTSRVTTSPVTSSAGAVGTSTLVRSDSGISFSLQTTGLPAGHAVTVWWMVVNPDAAAPSVLYAAGHVVGDSGAAGFGGSLQEGDTDGVVELPGLSLEGLLDATGATVVLVVRDHGPARPDIVEQQIHTFDVCNPEGVEHCTDLQMSIHAAAG
jgi:CDP-diglyceride synthetase